ncbi:MAG: class II aldolase/adducin family protein [Anaerolineae bacterium]|nr:class II aldolase/adducin family protein [Anaerolineae bacterium]
MILVNERENVLKYCQKMLDQKLTTGSGGNISIYNREENLVAISPGSMDYYAISAADVMVVDIEGNIIDGKNNPSSEMAFHLALLKAREDINAVIHTHSIYATAMACLRMEIPPLHYLVGLIGDKVPVAEYATFATPELAQHIIRDIQGYNACLLANHGVVAVGPDIEKCFIIAEHVELAAQIYLAAVNAGSPVLLGNDEMDRLQQKFRQYVLKPK